MMLIGLIYVHERCRACLLEINSVSSHEHYASAVDKQKLMIEWLIQLYKHAIIYIKAGLFE